MEGLAIIVIIIFLSAIFSKPLKTRKAELEQNIQNEIKSIVRLHFDTLLRKFNQKVYENDYGKVILDDWWKEEHYFVKVMILPELLEKIGNTCKIKNGKELYEYIISSKKYRDEKICINVYHVMHDEFFRIVDEKENEDDTSAQYEVKNGIDYENYVEDVFKKQGYIVSRTPTTGDQGVDLITEKDGIRCAIQCKFYSKPVGNKAIQEVIAGRGFYDCDTAMVVTNNSFTKSAKQLAKNSNVQLEIIIPS